MKIIALEEHFTTPEVIDAWSRLPPEVKDPAIESSSQGETARRLLDLGVERFTAMDEAGVDVQVVSLTTPGMQSLAPAEAVSLQVSCNDALAAAVAAQPERLQGFATLATPDPAAAVRELQRCVKTLGFNGAMLFGRTLERSLDAPEFWPLFECAEALGVPLYIHPQAPLPVVRAAYYGGIEPSVDRLFAQAGIGWHYETGVQLLRMILAGVFDRFPKLQLIAGHWGEVVMFYLDRIDMMAPVARLDRKPSEVFRDNIFVTPSGIFSQRYLRWAIEVVGIDRILFATDYPYVPQAPGAARRFLAEAELSDGDRRKIASENWERVCAAIRR